MFNGFNQKALATSLKQAHKQIHSRPLDIEGSVSLHASCQGASTVPMGHGRPLNILVLNHHTGSSKHGMAFRHFYLGKEWVRLGHRVTIVGASFSHIRLRQPISNGSTAEETIDGIRFLWLKTPKYDVNNFRRVLNMVSFILQLFVRQDLLVRAFPPDVVIASSTYPLDIYPAYWIARKYGAKLMFDVRDLWPLTPIALGARSRRHPFVMVLQKAEDFAYSKAQRVICALPKAKSYMVERGMRPEKFIYLPNGVDPDEWSSDQCRLPEEHESVLAKLRSEGQFLIGYAGAHSPVMDLHTLVEAASLLKDEPVSFVLVGHGPEKGRLEAQAGTEAESKVIFLPSVDKACVPRLLRSMDALYIGLKRSSLFKFGVSPNKLLDYMMAAKPVIHAIEAGNDIVAESGCGISIVPESPQELAKAVRRLMMLDPAERDRLGTLGQKYVLAMHDYKVLARRFLAELD